MKKKILAGLVTWIFVLSTAFIAQAALMEVVPASYSFDQTTSSGSYSYSDWGGVQLTDGKYGTAPWTANLGNGSAYEWVGWNNKSLVNIDFNLGSSTEINQINIGTVQDNPDDVVLPSVKLYSSSDGVNWSLFHNYSVPESVQNNDTYFTYEFTDLSVTDQYFRVSLLLSDDGPWTFTDEIDFYQESTPVPIPGAAWLLGSGIAGLVGLKRKKKQKDQQMGTD